MRPLHIHRKLVIPTTFLILLLLSNQHLFTGTAPSALIYDTKSVASGEWWRIFSHLLVHVSWYHLLLDATAVAIIWRELNIQSQLLKFGSAAICAACSLLVAVMFSPRITEVGFCGLSGMAHGLMFLLGALWTHQALANTGNSGKQKLKRTTLLLGCTLAGVSSIKSIAEVLSGSILLGNLHAHNLGTPIVHAHLGGVLGGLIAFVLYYSLNRDRRKTFSQNHL